MDKSFILVDVTNRPNNATKRGRPIDWDLCILCQEDTGEVVRDPGKIKRSKTQCGYDTLGKNLEEFQRLGHIPCSTDVAALNSGGGISNTLAANKAKWHGSCFLECSNSRLDRVRSSKHSNSENKPLPLPTRGSVSASTSCEQVCISCNGAGTAKNPLQKIEEEGEKILQKRASVLGDTKFLVRLQDFRTVKGAWIHKACRSRYNYEPKNFSDAERSPAVARQESLERVVSHMAQASQQTGSHTPSPVFSVPQLTEMYTKDLEKQGILTTPHSSRFKSKLLEACPDLEASGSPGQKSLVRFKKDVDTAVRTSCSAKDQDVILLAANKIRKDIFDFKTADWNNLSQQNVNNYVPTSLQEIVTLIIDGEKPSEKPDPVTSTIAQLLLFHARKKQHGKFRRHDVSKETPAPVYMAAKLYGETRKKELVDVAYRLGTSISYRRLHTILEDRANAACEQYRADGVVSPLHFQRGRFITGAVDNFDHNTSSMSCKHAFHGTVVSLMQHGPEGENRDLQSSREHNRKVAGLPPQYTVVPPTHMDGKNAKCPATPVTRPAEGRDAMEDEEQWLELCRNSATINTWPAHHSQQSSPPEHLTRFAILPIFREGAQSFDMMAHGLGLVINATSFLNPSQKVSSITADQPLFAILKQIQWLKPELYGEDKVFVMMGAMHIEQTTLRVLGDWLNGSGWSSALVQAEITTKGRAEAILSVSHLTRSRYAHQVTAAVLYDLKKSAYEKFAGDDPLTFEQWCAERKSFPQFRYWDIALRMQLLVLQLVRTLRTADFEGFIMAMAQIAPFFFALDHQNYARWMSVHIRDCLNLRQVHPTLWEQFNAGHFVAAKTSRRFSRIALDQAHEQLNALLKGNGGMIGLTEDPSALLKWMVTAPEVTEIVDTFETTFLKQDYDVDVSDAHAHHFDSNSARAMFSKDKQALRDFFERSGNPFAEESPNLYNIDTGRCCGPDVVDTVNNVERIGEEQYSLFCLERLQESRVPLSAPISRNKLSTFAKQSQNTKDKTKVQIKTLKNDVKLFSRMFLAISQNRPAKLDEFFRHENHEYPPSLALEDGSMRQTSKADLLNRCLLPLVSTSPDRPPEVDLKIFDGAVLMHTLKPGLSLLFSDYRDNIFLPYLTKEAVGVSRVDVVWDEYKHDSLKNMTRDKRGDGPRIIVTPRTKIPTCWRDFLRNSENKQELFAVLAEGIKALPNAGVSFYSTKGTDVISNNTHLVPSTLAPCNHEEADTRIFVHLADAVANGCTRAMITTCDTDVVVLACAVVPQLPALEELWVHRIAVRDNKFLPIHEIAAALGPQKSLALPAFHAFTGCDNVEAMYGIGKKTAWNAFGLHPQAIDALLQLAEGDLKGTEELNKLIIAMYSPAKAYDSLTKCRRMMFASSSTRQLEGVPATEDSSGLRTKRASLQAQVWRQLLKPIMECPNPSEWGYKKHNGEWVQVWRLLPVHSSECVALVHCKCNKTCAGNCSCARQVPPVSCTDLCRCVCNK